MPRPRRYDRWLLVITGLLVLAGLFMVGSASQYLVIGSGQGVHAFLVRQLVRALLGLGLLAVGLAIPYRKLGEQPVIAALLSLSFLSLVVVRFMPAAGGAHRWIHLGPIQIQPSEFVKIVVVVFMASLLARREEEVNDFQAVPLPALAAVGGLAMLTVIQPDLGSAVMMAATAGVMLFVAGLRWRSIGILAGAGAAAIAVAVLAEPYRMRRIRTFLEPGADPLNSGFQLNQSLIALGNGGVTGVGLGNGHQKAGFLPAPHTDFLYSVIGEELGLIGTSVLLVAFLLLFWRGIRTALRAPDRLGFYLALGITCLLVIQGLVHMGVCVGVLPTKGLPLPFLSYGGSSLVASLAAVGLLLNVSQHAD